MRVSVNDGIEMELSSLGRRVIAKQEFINEYVAEHVGDYQENSDEVFEAIENTTETMLAKLFESFSSDCKCGRPAAAQVIVDEIVDAHLVKLAEEAWAKVMAEL
jgi:hypothetical protein